MFDAHSVLYWFGGFAVISGLMSLPIPDAPETASYGAIGVGLGLILLGALLGLISDRTEDRRVSARTLKDGEEGTADIVSVTHESVKDPGKVRVRMDLRVRKPGRGLPLHVTHEQLVPTELMMYLRAGHTVEVRIDPYNPKRVEIVLDQLMG